MNFKSKKTPQDLEKRQMKKGILKNWYVHYGIEKVLDAFENKIFPKKCFLDFANYNLKIITPKQMLQRLPIALAHVKAGNKSENLLNETRQIVYSLNQLKKLLKKYGIT